MVSLASGRPQHRSVFVRTVESVPHVHQSEAQEKLKELLQQRIEWEA